MIEDESTDTTWEIDTSKLEFNVSLRDSEEQQDFLMRSPMIRKIYSELGDDGAEDFRREINLRSDNELYGQKSPQLSEII